VYSCQYGCQYELQRPHPWRISRRQTGQHLVRLSRSISFITEYCPLIQSLHFELLWERSQGGTAPLRTLEPLSMALKRLVQRRPSLEVIGAITRATFVSISKDASFLSCSEYPDVDNAICREGHDIELRLDGIRVHSRDDVVERWCRTTLRECIEYGKSVQFEPMNYIDTVRTGIASYNLHMYDWPYAGLQG